MAGSAAIMIIARGPDQKKGGFTCARDTRVVFGELCKSLMIFTLAMDRTFIIKIWHIYTQRGTVTLKCVAHVPSGHCEGN